MSAGERLDGIMAHVTDSNSADRLGEALRTLNELEAELGSDPGIDEIRVEALDRLARTTLSNLAMAEHSIVVHLLPVALRTKAESPNPWVIRQYGELLSNWFNIFPVPSRKVLRERILNLLVNELHGPREERAFQLITRIGYRSEHVTRLLWETINSRRDESGDIALLTLVTLGIPAGPRAEIITAWRTRAEQRWNHELVATALALAARECLDVVFDRWLLPANRDTESNRLALLPEVTLSIPAAIAEKHAGDSSLQEDIWNRLQRLEAAAPKLLRHRLLGSDQLGPTCDTALVVSYYLARLPEGEGSRDLAFSRLEKCIRPRQLQGWAAILPAPVLNLLRREMMVASGMPGQYETRELRRKLHAWRGLFALGRRDPLEHLGRMLDAERNGYAVGALLEEAAVFRFSPLPAKVCALIGGRFDDMTSEEGGRVSAHVAAIALAHASESRSAFDALLNFEQVRGKGGVLLSLIDALADNAESVANGGDIGVLADLWAATSTSNPLPRRTAATAAIGKLIRKRVVLPEPPTSVLSVLNDDTLDVYARREVIDALGTLLPKSVPKPVLDAILRVANSTTTDNTISSGGERLDLRPVALGALARLGLLASDTELLTELVGLRSESGVWRIDHGRPPMGGLASIVGLLYADRPVEFTPAVCELLVSGNWVAVSQMAPLLEFGPKPIPEPVYSALAERIRRTSHDAAETHLISLLARLAPERIATESWSGMFSWPPQSRSALADALAASPPNISSNQQRSGLLVVLMGDGQYGVRRAAYRALGRVDPTGLNSLCVSWASLTENQVLAAERPFVVDLRRRAAEGTAWLSSTQLRGVLADLESDPEPEVREAFTRCQRERREREWAQKYLQDVLAVQDEVSLLRAWRYGMALQQTGDDDVLEQLEQHRRRVKLPPGVRHWLGRLTKAIRSRWDEQTRNWPEPWFARQGRLEQVLALFPEYAADNPVVCWLWGVAEDEPVRLSWGGWCPDISLSAGESSLQVEGRNLSRVLVTQSIAPGGPSYFVGNGAYPEPTAPSGG